MRNSLIVCALLLAGCASQGTEHHRAENQQATSARTAAHASQKAPAQDSAFAIEDLASIDLLAELTAANAVSSAYVKTPERKPGRTVPIKRETPRAVPKAPVVSTPQQPSPAPAVIYQRNKNVAQPVSAKSAVGAGSAQDSLETAQRIAVAHGCERSVVLDYQSPGGVIYMASCQRGTVKKILCQGTSCRVMD